MKLLNRLNRFNSKIFTSFLNSLYLTFILICYNLFKGGFINNNVFRANINIISLFILLDKENFIIKSSPF